MKHIIAPLLALPLLLGYQLPTLADGAPTIEELWEIIQAQQAEIDALKKQQQQTADKALEADEKAEAAVVAVEAAGTGGSSAASWAERTRIGGYGELHYNNIDADDSDNDKDEIDFHRFVLYFGHEFTDRLRLVSEFEIEHSFIEDNNDGAGDNAPGEVEIEQAYIEYDINDQMRTRGGVFLLPVGILNETHEPNTYYGVERNDVENIIVPSSWWAGGAALSGNHANGISWDLAIHEGLKMDPDSGRVRGGRQKTGEADANDLAYTGRARYTGIPGLELAASLQYQTDASQDNADDLDEGLLFETHAIYQNGPFALRALYAEWDFDGDDAKSNDYDEQKGWYIEPSYKPWEKLGFYVRYEDVEGARKQDQFDQWEIGANYWPHEQVVLKVDFRSRDYDLPYESCDDCSDFDAFDLGIGYEF